MAFSVLSTAERAAILRKAEAWTLKNPDDLFGARMAVHDALQGIVSDTNIACSLLLPAKPPISASSGSRLGFVARMLEAASPMSKTTLEDYCRMAKMLIGD
jgi:hypothetical protein